jgi:hypothetical protein
MMLRKVLHPVLFASAILFVSGMAPQAAAQDGWQNPDRCEAGSSPNAILPEEGKILTADRMERVGLMTSTQQSSAGLEPVEWGLMVYDSNQGLCWLADANLAGNPVIRALMGVDGINPDGIMTYKVALEVGRCPESFWRRWFSGPR